MSELAERIERFGSLRFDEFMDLALYEPGAGFFARGSGAGRGGADFVTSPEVGPLFGAVMAGYLDRRWHAAGRPDPFVVVEAAAGRGALALAVLAADPECAPALRYVMVERSAQLRERQHDHLALAHPFEVLGPTVEPDEPGTRVADLGSGPLVCSLADLPSVAVDGVVIANELLDNLAVRLLERTAEGWVEVRVAATSGAGEPLELGELLVEADPDAAELARRLAPGATAGARVPIQGAAGEWLRTALGVMRSGSVLVIDYLSSTSDLAARPIGDWFRTYHLHDRGGTPLEQPGHQDLTCEVAVDQLQLVAPITTRLTQRDWLTAHDIGDLVEEGRRSWSSGAAAGGLDAVRGRSRLVESEALLDPSGLGAFEVLEWRVG